MNTQVGKWGNSLAVRIPGTYAKELHLEDGMEIEVTRLDDGLLLRPRPRMSGTIVRKPPLTSAGTWLRHKSPVSGKPCSRMTGVPDPSSRTWN